MIDIEERDGCCFIRNVVYAAGRPSWCFFQVMALFFKMLMSAAFFLLFTGNDCIARYKALMEF